MPFENATGAPRRIAVIGGGISGMGAAHALARNNNVTLFEAAPRLGGHARTIVAGRRGDQPVDTGFIVFNKQNYPNLTALFDELGVTIAESNMSFGVSADGGAVEYALSSADAMFAQRRNLARPAFLRMVRDIFRFNAGAEAAVTDRTMTIGDLLQKLQLGPWFRDYYLLPFSGAIWSTPGRQILDFPAHALVQFFRNHALLGYDGQHQWYTVRDGSARYVEKLEAAMRDRGVDLRLSSPVVSVRRAEGPGAQVRARHGLWEDFDEVVFASHSDVTLSLLSDATIEEKSLLSAIRYQPNRVVLHADASLMPKRRKVWASWVHTGGDTAGDKPIGVTYWMNSLQPIPQDDQMFVTLNPRGAVADELIYDEVEMRHPVYDAAALEAQQKLAQRNGTGSVWFCGAWMRNGFHEDGLASGLEVAERIERIRALAMAAE